MIKRIQKKLSLFSLALVFVVIVLGAFTRLSDAGLGCPDWPGCYGFLHIPTKDHHIEQANLAFPDQPYEFEKAWPEMVHRYFASTLGLVVIFLLAFALYLRKNKSEPIKLSVTLLFLICFQGALGAWTVTEMLHPLVVMGHLLGGFTSFSLLSVLAYRLYDGANIQWPKELTRVKTWVNISILILVIQIALGGWTSANYAALICTDLPFCYPGWTEHLTFSEAFQFWGHDAETYQYGVLSNEAKTTIHITHRIGAIVATVVIAVFLFKLKTFKASKPIKAFSFLVMGLLTTQVLLGLSNIVFHLPLWIAVAHNAVASLLLVSLVLFRTSIWMQNNRAIK